jgi:adenylate cyclase
VLPTASPEVERFGRLRRFFSPAVADMLLTGDAEDPLKTHRREIVVVFLDLRGYTSFTEEFGADEVMRVLAEFHAAMGQLVMQYGATLERFAGDGMMIFFNDPLEMDDPAGTAVRMALEMQQQFAGLQEQWQQRGYSLAMGIGIAQGVATIGAIGFRRTARLRCYRPASPISPHACAAKPVVARFSSHRKPPQMQVRPSRCALRVKSC